MILEHIRKSGRAETLLSLHDLVNQMEALDRLGIDKEEMHHPVKHIIVGKRPVLIDFERAHHTERPKNMTQFIEFLGRISKVLESKNINLNKQELITLAKEYSRTRDAGRLRGCLR
jgi:predicted Ser/Thr protein kinase